MISSIKNILWLTHFYFWQIRYMISGVQLSLYSTRALFHKYFVAIKYRWICIFFVLSESPPFIYKFDQITLKLHVWEWKCVVFIVYWCCHRVILIAELYCTCIQYMKITNSWPSCIYIKSIDISWTKLPCGDHVRNSIIILNVRQV